MEPAKEAHDPSIALEEESVKDLEAAQADFSQAPAGSATSMTTLFGVSAEELSKLSEDGNTEYLEQLGGVDALGKKLQTNLEAGLSGADDDIKRRQEAYGSNTFPEKPSRSLLSFLYEAMKDTTLIILAVCAVVSLGVGLGTEGVESGWYDGAGIVFAIVLVVLVTGFNNYRQAGQFRDLNAEKRKIMLQVNRGGRRVRVCIYDLVVGDIVHLGIGDQVPADGVFVSGHSLTIDESSMTGESDPVHKDARHPFLLSGCKVSDGFGQFLVTAVGMRTEWGKVMATLNEGEEQETPLQARLKVIATVLGKLGLTVAGLVFAALMIRWFATTDFQNFRGKDLQEIVNFFAIAVTVVVIAVPEGLPLAVTLTLGYSMRKMMADKALVRHLAACETMGSATTICSDKTGTLTLNQMSVVKSWVAGKLRDVESTAVELRKEAMDLLIEGICQNTSGSVFQPDGATEPEVTGSPTETAVLAWGLKMNGSFDKVKGHSRVLSVAAFNSAKKRMGVVVKANDGRVRVHWKGAAEILLEDCTHWGGETGATHAMTDEKRAELNRVIDDMAQDSLRALCLAYRDLTPGECPENEEAFEQWEIPEGGLTCAAIVGIKDPCRPGVPEAVAKCQAAGVTVRMVTGDNLVTAKAIASECGILTPGGRAMEGHEFRALSPAQQRDILPTLQVLARSSPTDKHALVKRLKSMGEVVGVTGDGTNDAPALREADIGLSMGLSGTEVAKESSDIVILDDNFASCIKVVRWGRSVFANIQKFVQFQLTINVVALTVNFVSAVASGTAPLTVVQLLWVNLIQDTLGALALATEPPTDDLMEQRPVGRREPLVTNVMLRNILGQSIYQLAVLLTLQFGGGQIFGLHEHERRDPTGSHKTHVEKEQITLIFTAFVFCQLFNEINCRRPTKFNVFEGLFTNPLFITVLVVTAAGQFVLVTYAGAFATTVPLSWYNWLICVAIGAVSMPVDALSKLVPVPKKSLWSRFERSRQRPVPLDEETEMA